MVIGDVSGDGRNDVIVMSGQSYSTPAFSVLTQTATGSLNAAATYALAVSSTLPSGIAVGDVNGDGKQDVAVSFGDASPAPQVAFYLQNASGALTTPAPAVTVGQRPAQLALLDANGDGTADIVAVNSYNYGIDVYLGTGGDNFAGAVSYAGGNNFDELATGDFNGDGKVDLAGASSSGTNQGIVLFTHR